MGTLPLLVLAACGGNTASGAGAVDDSCSSPACTAEAPRAADQPPAAESTSLPPPQPVELPPLPAARCETAQPLGSSGDSSASVSTAAVATPVTLGCGPPLGAGVAYFSLDLSRAAEAVPVQLVIDARFEFNAALARGACGDLRIEACGTPAYADERSRVITAPTLAPDRYWLVIDGAAASGEVHVTASVGQLGCSTPPTHDTCAQALPVDTQVPLQSLSGMLACAKPDLDSRCTALDGADVFYEIDLSDRQGETVLTVDVAGPNSQYVSAALFAPASAGCGELWMCGPQLAARLAPGVYRLGVSEGERDSPGPDLPTPGSDVALPYAVRMELSQSECSETHNRSWQTALDLDPTAERQRLQGNTACGDSQLSSPCNDDRGAPELIYRLDLRGAPGPRSLAIDNVPVDTVVYPYAEVAGSPPQPTRCAPYVSNRISYDLAPRLYYLVVDGRVRNAGRFDLDVRLDDLKEKRACVNSTIGYCMMDSEPACSVSLADPRCFSSAVECGLEPQTLTDFCAAAPGCCEGMTPADLCLDVWTANVQCY